MRAQHPHRAWREPLRNVVGDLRCRRAGGAQSVDRQRGTFRMLLTFCRRMSEECDKVVAMGGARDGHQPAPDAPEHAACGFPVTESGRDVTRDGLAHRYACIPCAQHGELIGIGESGRSISGGRKGQGEARFHAWEFSPSIVLLR